MLKLQFVFFLGFLAAASAINPVLEKSSFFLRAESIMSPELFQTRKGVITYTIEEPYLNQTYHNTPQYLVVNIENKTVTPILEDIMQACGQNATVFDRLHYHVATYTLVYYCTSNNSLLIIDEDDYSVQRVISTNITETFQEVRLTQDGYSIAILGLGGLLKTDPTPSHLIKISLQTDEVVNHVIFNHGLAAGEAVTAYASNGKTMNILTNIITRTDVFGLSDDSDSSDYSDTNMVTIYSMMLIGNSYNLTKLANFSSEIPPYCSNPINALFSIENLIITNNGESLVILNNKGHVLQTIENLSVLQAGGMDTYYRPEILSEYGSSDFYVLWKNNTVSKFTTKKGGYTSAPIATAASIWLAAKDQASNSLLFSQSLDSSYTVGNFTIMDLETSEIVYETFTNQYDAMITNSTYCVIQSGTNLYVYIFDLKTDALLKVIQFDPTENDYLYDQELFILTYINPSMDLTTFSIEQIDLQTGDIYTFSTFNFPVYLNQASNDATFNNPQFVLDVEYENYQYMIISSTFGHVWFNPQNNSLASDIVVDYDTLTVYLFLGQQESGVNVLDIYTYNSTIGNFTLASSTSNNDFSPESFYTGQGFEVAFNPFSAQVGVIEVPSLKETTHSINPDWVTLSVLQGSTENPRFVLSSSGSSNVPRNEPAGLYYDGKVQFLPGSNNYTIQAGAASVCSYWVANGVKTTFGMMNYYNICNQEVISQ